MAKQPTKLTRKANTLVRNARNRLISLATSLGYTFDGKRNMDKTLGYTEYIHWREYYRKYLRDGLAHRIVNAYPNATWDNDIRITDDNESEDETEFEQACNQLLRDSQLIQFITKADILANIGHYSVLLLGVRDGIDDLTQPIGNVKDPSDLLFLRAYGNEHAQIQKWNQDVSSERYGEPELYTLQEGDLENQSATTSGVVFPGKSLPVHWSRVIHIAEGSLTDPSTGIPRLQPVWNLFEDLKKTTGGAAEIYWRNAQSPIHVNVEGLDEGGPAQERTDDELEKIKDAADDMSHGLRRVVLTEGATVSILNQPVIAPDKHVAVILEQIAGAIGIPKRILVGSERGELASTQDETQWLGRVKERRERFAEPMILRPLIDRFITIGLLPKPIEGRYEVVFPELINIGAKDAAEIANKKGTTIVSYANSLAAQQLVPPRQFLREVMDMDYKEDEINEMLNRENDEIDEDNANVENDNTQPE